MDEQRAPQSDGPAPPLAYAGVRFLMDKRIIHQRQNYWSRRLRDASSAASMAGLTGHSIMTIRRSSRRSIPLAAALALFAALAASPARADHCDDNAAQLASAIDGLKVNFKAGNIIYLTHPAATELSLGCAGSEYASELYAKTYRKIRPAFFDLVASAAAVIFTLPKDDAATGTSRCLKRMGLLHGDKVTIRYKRLDLQCTRTKLDAAIVVRRGIDQ
jgi:hypothetical protein